MRALAFAAAPILSWHSAPGSSCASTGSSCSASSSTRRPDAVFVVNLSVLIYRLVAIVDAYRVAEYMNSPAASGDGRAGRARIAGNPLSVAGLLAVILVMAGSHVVVARYDMLAMDVLDSGCIFIGDDNKTCDLDATPSPSTRRHRRAEPGRLRRRPIRPSPRRPRPAAPCPRSRSRRGTARSGSTSC